MLASLATLVAVSGAILTFALWPPAFEAPPRSEGVLDGVVLVTPGLSRLERQRLTFRDGRIAAVAASTTPDVPTRYVLPGLVDMHVHLPPRLLPGLVGLFDSLFLLHGVTTIREVGSLDGGSLALAGQLERGERAGPRLIACGPILDGDPPVFPVAHTVTSRAEGEAVARALAARGARCLKVYENISPEALAGARAVAHELGLPIIGHLPNALPTSDPGLDDVQHLCYKRCGSFSPEERDVFVASAAERGIAHTPTLVVFEGLRIFVEQRALADGPPYALMPRFWRDALWQPVLPYVNPDALPAMQALVGKLHARGVRLHAGTDPIQPFVLPGASLHRELELLVASGLSIQEALAAATWVAGESLGVPGLGRLEVGAPADLLVLREDPTRDLAALSTLEAVVADGRLYSIEELRAAADEQRAYFERAVVDVPLRAAAHAGIAIARRSFASGHPEVLP
jgi:cytosine/adenosine deaminase-related metal-dependent hydrolase